MGIKKVGARLPFTFEAISGVTSEKSRGCFRKLTTEERTQWVETRNALKLLKKSPWVEWDHEDGYVLKEPRKWVSDE